MDWLALEQPGDAHRPHGFGVADAERQAQVVRPARTQLPEQKHAAEHEDGGTDLPEVVLQPCSRSAASLSIRPVSFSHRCHPPTNATYAVTAPIAYKS